MSTVKPNQEVRVSFINDRGNECECVITTDSAGFSKVLIGELHKNGRVQTKLQFTNAGFINLKKVIDLVEIEEDEGFSLAV